MNRQQRRAQAAKNRQAGNRDVMATALRLKASQAFRDGNFDKIRKLGITTEKLDESIALIDNGQAPGVTPEVRAWLVRARAYLAQAEPVPAGRSPSAPVAALGERVKELYG